MNDLYRKIDEILWKDWDPIGVNDVAPRNEYQGYTPEIYKMVMENKTEILQIKLWKNNTLQHKL